MTPSIYIYIYIFCLPCVDSTAQSQKHKKRLTISFEMNDEWRAALHVIPHICIHRKWSAILFVTRAVLSLSSVHRFKIDFAHYSPCENSQNLANTIKVNYYVRFFWWRICELLEMIQSNILNPGALHWSYCGVCLMFLSSLLACFVNIGLLLLLLFKGLWFWFTYFITFNNFICFHCNSAGIGVLNTFLTNQWF